MAFGLAAGTPVSQVGVPVLLSSLWLQIPVLCQGSLWDDSNDVPLAVPYQSRGRPGLSSLRFATLGLSLGGWAFGEWTGSRQTPPRLRSFLLFLFLSSHMAHPSSPASPSHNLASIRKATSIPRTTWTLLKQPFLHSRNNEFCFQCTLTWIGKCSGQNKTSLGIYYPMYIIPCLCYRKLYCYIWGYKNWWEVWYKINGWYKLHSSNSSRQLPRIQKPTNYTVRFKFTWSQGFPSTDLHEIKCGCRLIFFFYEILPLCFYDTPLHIPTRDIQHLHHEMGQVCSHSYPHC